MAKETPSKYADYDNEILSIWQKNEHLKQKEIAEYLYEKHSLEAVGVTEQAFQKYVNRLIMDQGDKEIIQENVKLAKQKQKAQDNNRIANKSFREHARIENAVEEFAKEISNQNKLFAKDLSKLKLKNHTPSKTKNAIGVIQITDVHGNELIDLPHNKYDFNILSKRMKKHVSESLRYFKFRGVSKVLIAFTGDLLNSDRRLDELLNASTNRAKATVLMIHILKQAILEVRESYPVDIVSVLGNESRANKEMTFSNEALSDNYDFTIIAQLKQIFEFAKIKDVNFKSYQNVKEIVKIGSQKWLISHNLSGAVDSQVKTQSEIGMYSLMGHKIDFSIGGHIHALRLTDISARSSSMSGSNTYNENALGLIGRATHNCYVVEGDSRFIQVNDLQDVNGVTGYEVVSQLEAYNAKSNTKLKKNVAIMQIVI